MKKVFLLLLILSVLCGAVYSSDNLLKQLDDLYFDRDNPKSVATGVKAIKVALQEEPQNYELLWRLSRFYVWIGDLNISSKEANLFDYEQGDFYADKAIIANESGVEGHFWKGVLLKRIAEKNGYFYNLETIDPIRLEMEIVINYNEEHAGAHCILSDLYLKTPGKPLSIRNKNKALEEALLGVKYRPDCTFTRLGLAQVYLSLDEKDKAIKQLELILELDLPSDYIPEGRADKVRASELLRKLKNKK